MLKIKFYIISLWLLFLLIFVSTANIPTCFASECQFIGFFPLLTLNIAPAISIIFMLLTLKFYSEFSYDLKGAKKIPLQITEISDENYEHLTFLTTYIVPLISLNLASTRYVLILFILLFVIGAIYTKTDKYFANPTLAILGFRLYKVSGKTVQGDIKNTLLISKDRIKIGDNVAYLIIDELVFYGRKK